MDLSLATIDLKLNSSSNEVYFVILNMIRDLDIIFSVAHQNIPRLGNRLLRISIIKIYIYIFFNLTSWWNVPNNNAQRIIKLSRQYIIIWSNIHKTTNSTGNREYKFFFIATLFNLVIYDCNLSEKSINT